MTSGAAMDRPASHDIEGTHNFRDVGGVRTADGRLAMDTRPLDLDALLAEAA